MGGGYNKLIQRKREKNIAERLHLIRFLVHILHSYQAQFYRLVDTFAAAWLIRRQEIDGLT